ncbi:unnamed protein product [Rotaria sp. Silwood1]|nr:unnamed protein product [Rotaria sp. Silwood1]CAF1079392.1 unnamed protein product [Rotaria sp. Silwood1]CAF3412305.1 unnamed protein product [Rotaria sp. Silwood1]CAF3437926.1 unnamed protein product [Rotaria sp. Silwood1]CAF4491191.1 unnamed protein product [Rotaria sp. Silwood1]
MMSTPGSQHLAGTDYPHRESMTSQYHVIAETKSRLRILIYFHFLLAFLVFIHILTYHIPLIAILDVPRPHLWEYIWLNSVLPSICGLLSLNKNRVFLMRICFRGTLLFGLGTIVTTIILNLSELFTFKKLKSSHKLDEIEPQKFLGFPLLVLWYIFLVITVQIHAFSLYMANVLLCSWQQYKSTKHY